MAKEIAGHTTEQEAPFALDALTDDDYTPYLTPLDEAVAAIRYYAGRVLVEPLPDVLGMRSIAINRALASREMLRIADEAEQRSRDGE